MEKSDVGRKLNRKPVKVSSNCSRDRIIFANSEDQTCSRVEDRLKTVEEVGTCPIEKAVGEIDSNEGMDQGLDC